MVYSGVYKVNNQMAIFSVVHVCRITYDIPVSYTHLTLPTKA